MDSERTERFERSETEKSLITNGIEFRIFENSQTLPKRLIEKEKRKTKKNENYLIEYFQKCENDSFQKLKPITKTGIKDEDLIFFYGNKYHENPCRNQREENIFVLMDVVEKIRSQKDRKRYKELMIKLLNVMNFGCFNSILLSSESLENLNSFQNYLQDFLFII